MLNRHTLDKLLMYLSAENVLAVGMPPVREDKEKVEKTKKKEKRKRNIRRVDTAEANELGIVVEEENIVHDNS